jgi:hypothetical protein
MRSHDLATVKKTVVKISVVGNTAGRKKRAIGSLRPTERCTLLPQIKCGADGSLAAP